MYRAIKRSSVKKSRGEPSWCWTVCAVICLRFTVHYQVARDQLSAHRKSIGFNSCASYPIISIQQLLWSRVALYLDPALLLPLIFCLVPSRMAIRIDRQISYSSRVSTGWTPARRSEEWSSYIFDKTCRGQSRRADRQRIVSGSGARRWLDYQNVPPASAASTFVIIFKPTVLHMSRSESQKLRTQIR